MTCRVPRLGQWGQWRQLRSGQSIQSAQWDQFLMPLLRQSALSRQCARHAPPAPCCPVRRLARCPAAPYYRSVQSGQQQGQ